MHACVADHHHQVESNLIDFCDFNSPPAIAVPAGAAEASVGSSPEPALGLLTLSGSPGGSQLSSTTHAAVADAAVQCCAPGEPSGLPSSSPDHLSQMITCLTQAIATFTAAVASGAHAERRTCEGEVQESSAPNSPLIDFADVASPLDLLTGDATNHIQSTIIHPTQPADVNLVAPSSKTCSWEDRCSMVQGVADDSHLYRELSSEEAEQVASSASEYVKEFAKQQAHWEAEARIHLQSGGYRYGTVGSHAIRCVLFRRELCCHGVGDDGIVRLSEGRRINRRSKEARRRRQAQRRARKRLQQQLLPTPLLCPMLLQPTAGSEAAAVATEGMVSVASVEGSSPDSPVDSPHVGVLTLSTENAGVEVGWNQPVESRGDGRPICARDAPVAPEDRLEGESPMAPLVSAVTSESGVVGEDAPTFLTDPSRFRLGPHLSEVAPSGVGLFSPSSWITGERVGARTLGEDGGRDIPAEGRVSSGTLRSWVEILREAVERGDEEAEAREVLDSLPNEVRRHLAGEEMRYASLMAGLGGRSMGYHLDHEAWHGIAVETDTALASVHSANIPTSLVLQHKMTADRPLPEGFPTFQLFTHLLAGPPCQPYSKGGKGEGREDPRDGIPAVLKAILVLRPLIVEIENVPEIQKYDGVVEEVVQTLEGAGYWVEQRMLVASDYDVPQRRKSFFLVASLLGLVGFPTPTSSAVPLTVSEAIGSDTVFDAFEYYDPSLELTEAQRERAARLDIMSRCVNLRELHPNRPSRTITASGLANKHSLMPRLRLADGETLRRLSVEEAACLQSFPNTFNFSADLI